MAAIEPSTLPSGTSAPTGSAAAPYPTVPERTDTAETMKLLVWVLVVFAGLAGAALVVLAAAFFQPSHSARLDYFTLTISAALLVMLATSVLGIRHARAVAAGQA